jgi:hypothetical protein
MEDTNKKDAVAGRRDFLKGSAVSVAAVGVAAVAGKSASAGEVEVVSSSGYRETEHVKAFYASARF